MLVTLTRDLWRRIVAQAASHAREGLGVLVGRRTRTGNALLFHELAVPTIESTSSHARYYDEEVERARATAVRTYEPLEPLGTWHSHPYKSRRGGALNVQISNEDLATMREEEFELICACFPYGGQRGVKTDLRLERVLNGTVCRAEAWCKLRGEAVPCRLRVR